jgi:hypothetical protein
MRYTVALLCLILSAPLAALKPADAPTTMDTVREAWTQLEWGHARQARAWFQRATQSKDPVTAYYGWEGIADADAKLAREPQQVLAAYERARRHLRTHVLDDGLHKRLDDRLKLYQQSVVEATAPGKKWQGRAGRLALQAIGEGKHGADPQLRLAAYETLGDRALDSSRSRTASEAAAGAFRLALNQGPDTLQRQRLQRKLNEALERMPGGERRERDDDYDQAGLVADPRLLALMNRCSQCAGQGGKQRRACAEVSQAYTLFYGPGQKRPNETQLKRRVEALQKKLVDAGCF